jgi:hypothetical protein
MTNYYKLRIRVVRIEAEVSVGSQIGNRDR